MQDLPEARHMDTSLTTVHLIGNIIGHNWYGQPCEMHTSFQIDNYLIRRHGFKGAIEYVLREEGGDFQDPSMSQYAYFVVERTTHKTANIRVIHTKTISVNRFIWD